MQNTSQSRNRITAVITVLPTPFAIIFLFVALCVAPAIVRERFPGIVSGNVDWGIVYLAILPLAMMLANFTTIGRRFFSRINQRSL